MIDLVPFLVVILSKN
ncbi:hypothetical protein VCHENC02_3767A, partial [Vibrio harveyi]